MFDAQNHHLDQLPVRVKCCYRALTEQMVKLLGFPGAFGFWCHKTCRLREVVRGKAADPDFAILRNRLTGRKPKGGEERPGLFVGLLETAVGIDGVIGYLDFFGLRSLSAEPLARRGFFHPAGFHQALQARFLIGGNRPKPVALLVQSNFDELDALHSHNPPGGRGDARENILDDLGMNHRFKLRQSRWVAKYRPPKLGAVDLSIVQGQPGTETFQDGHVGRIAGQVRFLCRQVSVDSQSAEI